MIPLNDIELNGLRFNDCIDIFLKYNNIGYKKFFFTGFDTCVVSKNNIKERMIINLIITPMKAASGINTKPIRIPIDNISSIIIND